MSVTGADGYLRTYGYDTSLRPILVKTYIRMVVGGGLRLALFGVAVGVVGALLGTRVLKSLVYQVRTTDPLTPALRTVAERAWKPMLGPAGQSSRNP